MKEQHPLDAAFGRRLTNLEAEVPAGLWERIDEKRDTKHRAVVLARRQLPWYSLIGMVAVFGLSWVTYTTMSQELDAFPIPYVTDSAIALVKENDNVSQVRTPQLVTTEQNNTTNQDLTSPSFQQRSTSDLGLKSRNIVPDTKKAKLSENVTDGLSPVPVAPPLSFTEEQLPEDTDNVVALSSLPLVYAELQQDETKRMEEAGLSIDIEASQPACAYFDKDEWVFYVDALVSPDWSFKRIEAMAPHHEAYADSRSETERYQYAFSTALRLSLVSDKGLAFRTGVNYSQIRERFRYFNGTEVRTEIVEILNEQGEVIGYDEEVQVGSRYKVTHNTYQMLDIPLLIGYERALRHLNVSVNAGAYLNLLFRQQGDILSPGSLTPVAIDSGDSDAFPAFKQQMGIGWYGSLGLAYRATDRLQLLVEPHVKVFPKSVTQEQYGVTQEYTTAGLFMGIRYRM